jgi:uncharacterized protein YbjT (DUF2867 family)
MFSPPPKLALTGSTGGLGSRVLHHLLHTLNYDPSSVIISLYKPSSLPPSLKSLKLDIRHGDFTIPSTLSIAFAGADKLLLVSYPSIAHSERVTAHKNAIDAAIEAGVNHIYYRSLAFAGDSEAAVMRAHIDTEAYLKRACGERGVGWTVIKEGIYAESFPLYFGCFDKMRLQEEERAVKVPSLGRGVAWVARDDLMEGTARIVAGKEGRWDGKSILLSGGSVVGFEEFAGMITEVLGWGGNSAAG